MNIVLQVLCVTSYDKEMYQALQASQQPWEPQLPGMARNLIPSDD